MLVRGESLKKLSWFSKRLSLTDSCNSMCVHSLSISHSLGCIACVCSLSALACIQCVFTLCIGMHSMCIALKRSVHCKCKLNTLLFNESNKKEILMFSMLKPIKTNRVYKQVNNDTFSLGHSKSNII